MLLWKEGGRVVTADELWGKGAAALREQLGKGGPFGGGLGGVAAPPPVEEKAVPEPAPKPKPPAKKAPGRK